MENPASWGPVENAIEEAIKEHSLAKANGVFGASLVMTIANKLRAEGFIDGDIPQD